MPADVLTNRYSNSRSGVTSNETRLTIERVSTSTFGKLFARTVDGDLYAQPLIVSNLEIGGIRRNVVYLATSRNYVYAYDADDPLAYLPLWTTNLGPAAPRDAIFPGYGNFASEVGVTSTPVIEREGEGGTIFLVAKTMDITELGQRVFQYKLHALNILTGKERRKPTLIEAVVQNAAGQTINFDPQLNLNRPGLLLREGVLYIAFGSHGDKGDFYGWVMAYSARTLARIATYNTAPDWGQGGIWQSGTGLAGDNDGNVYAVVGNGASERANNARHPPILRPAAVKSPVYGNALLKLKLVKPRKGPAKLKVVDWFTASDVFELNNVDSDFIGGPVLFEAPGKNGEMLELLLGGGKDGKFYLVDCENLGKWTAGSNTAILQADQLCTFHIHGAPVVWRRANGEIRAFVWSEKDFLKSFALRGSSFDKTPLSTSDYGLPQDELRMPGGVLSLSWDGKDDESAILWASHPTHEDAMNKTVSGTLRAYDAMDLNKELWTSDMNADGDDRAGCLAKFCPPVVANGKVYLATFSRELVVYGLFEDAHKDVRTDDVGIFQLRDFGPVQKSGSYVCSRYDLRIVGSGIGETKDEFLLASVERNPAQGEIEVTARVDGIRAPDCPNARVGVMIRRSFDQRDRFAAVTITNQNQALFLHRDEAGESVKQDGPFDITFPVFVRLVARSVDAKPGRVAFTGAISKDGAAWLTISAFTEIDMDIVADIDLRAGLAVTAQTGPNVKAPGSQAHAIFSRVKVT
jgi:hypothetical protein